MALLETFVSDLQEFLIGSKENNHNIIRRHSKKLEELGDLSFPLPLKNWFHLIQKHETNGDNIFQHRFPNLDLETQCEQLKLASRGWNIDIAKICINQCDAHLYLNRSKCFQEAITDVISKSTFYGSYDLFTQNINVRSLLQSEIQDPDLTHLRLSILENVTRKLVQFTSVCNGETENLDLVISVKPAKNNGSILCSPVINEHGLKSCSTASDLYNKRTSDMRMMAQHKYGVQVKGSNAWDMYFEKLGKACVTIEMLSNKPQKPIKLSLNDLQTAHKGASFIFYNCARLAALLKQFDKKIMSGVYPNLPEIDDIDFSLLNQPDEWELFYGYIVQFPLVVKSCIRDVEKGILNPQYLVSFLANLSSVFSVYYRRIRILTDSRDHLHAVLYARIYLLKALQIVFHNTLSLLDIEPVKEM